MELKIAFVIILVNVTGVLATPSYSQVAKVSLNMENKRLEQVMDEIESQSEFYFIFNQKQIDVNRVVDIQADNKLITDILPELFKGTDVNYAILDKKILLTTDPVVNNLLTASSGTELQQNRITGTVTDEKNNPLPGVTIVVKGTTLGALTDISGKYTLNNVPQNAILTFSFVGMKTQEIPLDNRTLIDVVLQETAVGLDEVVVVGYGTQKKASVTGSIATTDNKMIKSSPTTSLSNSLSGLLPGVTALNRTGEPGENVAEIFIRGRSTTGDSNPLVVVDGIPDENGAWQRINQNDIEQISVLKDASASIYGSRAANGVILITTKRGGISKPIFNYTYNQGFTQPTKLPEMANSWEFAEYVNQYRETIQNLDPLYTDKEIQTMKDGTDLLNYPNADWVGTIFKNFSTQSMHNLNVRGGTEKARYSMSGSRTHENSLVNNGIHEFTSYGMRSSVDVDLTDNIKFGLDLNGGMDERMSPVLTSFGADGSPLISPFYPNGLPASLPGDAGENPAINLAGAGGYFKDKVFRASVKPFFDVKIPKVKGLGIEGFFSFRTDFNENKRWRDTWKVYNYDKVNDKYVEKIGGQVSKPDLQEIFNKHNDYLVHLRVKYERTFGDHALTSFVAVEQAEGAYKSITAYRKDFISPAIEELFAGNGENMLADGTSTEWGRQNLFGRITYSFKKKYLFETNLRYDGSYAFPKDKRWGFFPGVSVGWRLSEENFLRNVNFLSDLKLRASYGQMGNDNIDAFQYLTMYTLAPIGTHFGGGTQGVLTTGVAPNANITWEVAENSNVGFDASLWDGGLGITFDAFKQRRSNILTARSTEVPVYTGLVLPDENIGIIENKGFELSLSHRNKVTSEDQLSYSLSGNVSYSKNKIIDVSEPQDMPEYQKKEGNVIGSQLLYNALGIFRTQEQVDSNPIFTNTQVGDLQYEDVNKDGVINTADRVRQDKGTIPEITFGLNASVSYKRFSVLANIAGQANAWTYLHKYCRTTQNGLRDLIINRYTPGSMDSKYPIIPQEDGVGEGEVSGQASTFWLQNASFLRLKTLQLQYSLPEEILSKLRLSSMMLFVNGNNLFTLTKMEWYDPEGTPEETTDDNDVTYSTGNFYPQVKIFNIGVNITF